MNSHTELFQLIAQDAEMPISGGSRAAHCNYGPTDDKTALFQVRVHEDHLEVGLAFDRSKHYESVQAADEYEKALTPMVSELRRYGKSNQYLMVRIDCALCDTNPSLAKRAASILNAVRDAVEDSGVVVAF
jgi:hypothetical protein